MKTIERIVTNFELSKKLMELGVPQDSIYYWVEGYINTRLFWTRIYTESKIKKHIPGIITLKIVCSAWTLAELGEMYLELPSPNETDDRGLSLVMRLEAGTLTVDEIKGRIK